MRIGSVEFEKKGRVAVLTLDEPTKLNAISVGIRQGVTEGLAMVEADPEIRVGIVTGRGDKAFCAGADISSFPETPEQARCARALIAKARAGQLDHPDPAG